MNDAGLILLISMIFVSLGAVMPLLNDEYGTHFSNYTVDPGRKAAGALQDSEGGGFTSMPGGVVAAIKSIASMFFWTFGSIPWMFELLFLEPLRLTLYFVVGRNLVRAGA